MKVFFDTNVLVSAYLARGLCAELFAVVSREHECLTSEAVLHELQRILSTKAGASREQIAEAVSILREHTVVPVPRTVPANVNIRDPSDVPILASAVAAGVDVLVTGDRDLLDVAAMVPSVRTVDPRTLWEMLEAEPISPQ